MTSVTHVRYEILRGVRNRAFAGLTIALPLGLFYGVASGQRHAGSPIPGTSFPLYFMTAMAAYGAMWAVFAPGGRIARDRSRGWTRQLMLTPLRGRTEVAAKVVSGYLLALPTLLLLFLAGLSLGVRLDAGRWLELAGLLLAGIAPLVVAGLVLGYLLPPDAVAPATGGAVILLSLFGGVFGFNLATSGPLFQVMKALPSYWLVQAGKTAYGGADWPAQAWIVIAIWLAVLIPVAALAFRRSAARA